MHPHFPALATIRHRSRTWPPDAAGQRHPGVVAMSSSTGSNGMNVATDTRPSQNRVSSEEDNDEDPAKLFLSPVHMYEYDDWSDSADDEDDEDGDIDWDAGITDFSLYDDDRRRARDTGAALPGRWNGLLSSQASALQRSRERSLAWSLMSETDGRTAAHADRDYDESLPGLTPDTSPHLYDDLEDSDPNIMPQSSSSAPNLAIPSITLTTPATGTHKHPSIDDHEDDEDGIVLSFHAMRRDDKAPLLPRIRRIVERPGLRQSRTLSGHRHVWTRPSCHIHTVAEERCAERAAELAE